jgi:hypothetical protein
MTTIYISNDPILLGKRELNNWNNVLRWRESCVSPLRDILKIFWDSHRSWHFSHHNADILTYSFSDGPTSKRWCSSSMSIWRARFWAKNQTSFSSLRISTLSTDLIRVKCLYVGRPESFQKYLCWTKCDWAPTTASETGNLAMGDQ